MWHLNTMSPALCIMILNKQVTYELNSFRPPNSRRNIKASSSMVFSRTHRIIDKLSHKLKMFGLSNIECKVNGITFPILTFDKSYRTIYKLTLQSLDRYWQLFQKRITDWMFSKSHCITRDVSIVWIATVR